MLSLKSVAEDPVALLPPLREVIAAAELAAKKSLGQNFLLDLNLTRRIARSVQGLGEGTVIEVGPGPGGLTRALLLEGAQHVIAIERDSRAVAALQPLVGAAGRRLTLIEGDALTFDYQATPAPRRIVANLPYNIGTPLLIGWLEHSSDYASLTLMFQKEVADRLLAAPGSKTYGRLSVMAQWRCDVQRVMDLPARAFTPPPKVDSSVVQFIPRVFAPTADADWKAMERVVAAAFGQRRKMLRSALKSLCPDPESLLRQAGLDPTARAEEIPVAGYVRLSQVWLNQV